MILIASMSAPTGPSWCSPPARYMRCPDCDAECLVAATSRKGAALFEPRLVPEGRWCWNRWTRRMHRALWPRWAYRAHWCPDLRDELDANR